MAPTRPSSPTISGTASCSGKGAHRAKVTSLVQVSIPSSLALTESCGRGKCMSLRMRYSHDGIRS